MNPRSSRHAQCFFGTLEQCLEKFGGKSEFTVSDPLTFFSGARLETHRRAESNDGTVVIIERQLSPTSCEVYVRSAAMAPQSAHTSSLAHSNCA